MKFVYMVTSGTADQTKGSLPLHLVANGSVEVGHEVAELLAGDATEILLGETSIRCRGSGCRRCASS